MPGIVVRVSLLAALVLTLALLGGNSPVNAGGGVCHQPPPREGTGSEVQAAGNCFSPTILRVEAGATVTFRNMDPVVHEVSGVTGDAVGQNELAEGATVSRTFASPGVYPYYCNLHFGMVGAIVVGDGRASTAGGSNPRVSDVLAAVPEQPQGQGTVASTAASADEGNGPAWWQLAAIAALGALAGGGLVLVARR